MRPRSIDIHRQQRMILTCDNRESFSSVPKAERLLCGVTSAVVAHRHAGAFQSATMKNNHLSPNRTSFKTGIVPWNTGTGRQFTVGERLTYKGRPSMLVVSNPKRVTVNGRRMIEVTCDCGTVKLIRASGFNRQISCGCSLDRFQHSTFGALATTHGMTGSPPYRSWQNMKKRCYQTGSIGWKHYGGRGITVCERWLHSFENFFADMGERPKGKTIDRINVNRNYEPTNCKWSTYREQARNTQRAARLQIQQGASLPHPRQCSFGGDFRSLIGPE